MAEGDRHFLGLTHNPFVPPQTGFFERGGRKKHLEQLRHLSEWSRRVLLITGPEGCGKTILYRELAATLEPRVKAARINAALVNTGREVLNAVAQGFGLAVPSNANTQVLRSALLDHVDEQVSKDRLCLTLIDDAHLLDNKAIDELMILTQESALHLVLFGEVIMAPVIERAASSKGVGWQEIRLSGFDDADARDYLEWRFRQARYRGRIPFTDHQVRELVVQSEGLPGKMNEMGDVLLTRLESGVSDEERGGFPKLHVGLLGLVAAILGLMYVLVIDDAPPAGSEQPEVAVERVETESTSGSSTIAADPPAVAASDLEVAPADISAHSKVSDSPRDADLAGSAPSPFSVEPATDAETGSPAVIDTTAVVEAAAPITEGERSNQGSSDAMSVVAERIEPETVPLVENDGVPQVAPPGQNSATRYRNTDWLLGQDPKAYTLQLLTVSSLDRAEAFVDGQRAPDEFAIYQLARDERILHVVLFGLFGSREEAETAADSLPEEVGRVQPWIRPLEQIQGIARISVRN